MSFMYPHTIELRRPRKAVGDGGLPLVGKVGYQGLTPAEAVSSQGGEDVLYTGVFCSIQNRAGGRVGGHNVVPSNAAGMETWKIYIPRSSPVARDSLRDGDVAVDGQGYRYQCTPVWDSMGYRLECVRLEA